MRNDEDLDQVEHEDEAVEEGEEHATAGMSGVVGFAAGLFCGALIGAGVALLVAPERGVRLRHRLARTLRDAGDDLREELGDLRDSARRRLSRRRRRMRRGVGRVVS
jgi:gas vesicle protein